jgi:predicted nucleic acid-binding protein
MTVESFLDTNILLYAASRNPAHLSKKTRAAELIEKENFGLSAQVFQEFYANATRKADVLMSAEAALRWIENLEEFPCQSIDAGIVKAAIVISERYKISYWDGAILAAAEALGAGVLYSEDLNHGQVYGSVLVTNPFLGLPPQTGFHEPQRVPFERDGA